MPKWPLLANYQMIKQAKNKLIFVRTMQFLLLFLGVLLQYFSKKKMGVQRTITYYNYYLEENYHIKEILFLVAFILLIYIFYRWFTYNTFYIISLLCILLIFLLIFVDIRTFKLTKYAISIILVLVNILELLKIGEKNEKN